MLALFIYNIIVTQEGERRPSSRIEQEQLLTYKSEILQYHDQQLGYLITGEQGTKFDWEKFKWTPYEPGEEGLVSTRSGNEYYIYVDDDERTWIVNTRESERTGNIVAVHQYFYQDLPPITFGEPWRIPNFYRTSAVESILLGNQFGDTGNKIDEPIPFTKHRHYFRKPTP